MVQDRPNYESDEEWECEPQLEELDEWEEERWLDDDLLDEQ